MKLWLNLLAPHQTKFVKEEKKYPQILGDFIPKPATEL